MSHDKHGDFVEFILIACIQVLKGIIGNIQRLMAKMLAFKRRQAHLFIPRFPNTRCYKSKVITILQLAMHVEIGCE